MTSKLNYLIGVSLKRKIKTKWFVIVNIILAIVLVGLINIDSIITFFGGDFSEKTKVYVIDNTNETFEIFKENMRNTSKTLYGDEDNSYEIISYDKDVEEAKKLLDTKEDSSSIIIVIDSSVDNTISAKMISKEYMDMVDTQLLNSALNSTKISLALSKSSISMEEINKIYNAIEVERVYLDEKKNSVDENMEMIMSSVFPILILPFFMLAVFLIQMIGAEVNDEKTTRSMEIIISNVSPETHFLSKVLASTLFVVIQGLLLLGYAIIAVLSRFLFGGGNIINDVGTGLASQMTSILTIVKETGILTTLLQGLPWILLLFLVSFILYGIVAGVLASMTTSMEDFQQLQTPIMLIIMVGYYLAIMASQFEGATFIKIMSYVPMLSFMLSPSLFLLGQISIYSLAMATLINIIFTFIIFKYGLRIYKVGILNYSSTKLWKKMFKSLKNKE